MTPYVQLLYQALASPLGIIVEHENPRQAQAIFSAQRKKHNDPALQRISITVLEEQPKRLFLVKCPDEKQDLLSAVTSGSLPTTSSG